MVQLTRIYTKSGDKGKSSLGNGARHYKHHARFQAIGSVDEVNATIGLARLYVSDYINPLLEHIQQDLFDIGADLCMPNSEEPGLKLQEHQVLFLEKELDLMNAVLFPLTSFVLPGGSKSAGFLHLARTTTRRAERDIVALAQAEEISGAIIQYVNRLSDFLFVAARFDNDYGTKDILWQPGKNQEKGVSG